MHPILQRLDQVANTCFGSRANLARAINKTPDSVNSYFSRNSLPGSEFLAALRGTGVSTDWLLTGEGSMYADNEAGTALAIKNSVTYPGWAKELRTPPQRIAKIIELLGGFEQAEAVLHIPRHELQDALTATTPSLSVISPCKEVGFSLYWVLLGINPYHNTFQPGMVLAKAVETGKIAEWATELFINATINQNEGFTTLRTVGQRMGLARILLCEFRGEKDTPQVFAQFLSQHPSNVEGRVFTASDIEAWEANTIVANDALPIAVEAGINRLWLMTGEEAQGIFAKNEEGKKLSQWYAAQKAISQGVGAAMQIEQ